MSRYRLRHLLLTGDIISKLLQRIANNRLGLIDYYRSVEKVIGGIATVTRQQWQEGLQKVLKIPIKFLEVAPPRALACSPSCGLRVSA